ncbi:MAG: regulatory iron-sulfur-containing complex subunit RicT, partial [Planctomycetota bacterium]|nr:regulatory iron-sulfur-containing complex subunit RicT [Planctomycetota bacterium]
TTCPNSGCGKSVSRNEMLEYIDNSGGSEYPFRSDGKILRVADIDDLNRWSSIQAETRARVPDVKAAIEEMGLAEKMSLVELEPVLSQEHLTVFYLAEERVDFRDLVQWLAREFTCRIEMKQVGARDEARLVADYEKCGQHCCCKNFLKVLKPVSMRSAKTQKASLDPLKISGRCGRLMCCLRYEDETYADLKKRLPHRKTRVGTPEGPGIVLDSKILVQLVLVKLEADGREVAVPVEELCDPDNCPVKAPEPDPFRGLGGSAVEEQADDRKRQRRRRKSKSDRQAEHKAISESAAEGGSITEADAGSRTPETGDPGSEEGGPKKKKRRRRRRKKTGDGATPAGDGGPDRGGDGAASTDADGPRKKRRRRRRRRKGGGEDGGGAAGGDSGGD